MNCPTCESLLHDDGYCGVCAAERLGRLLLAKGCCVCHRTNLSDTDMEPGWLSVYFDLVRDGTPNPGISCELCIDKLVAGKFSEDEERAVFRALRGEA